MKIHRKSALVVALVAGAAGAGMYAGVATATPSSGLSTTILAKSLFDPFQVQGRSAPADAWQALLMTHGQSNVYVVDNKLAPGGTTGWHSHPGPSLVLVVSGAITDYSSLDPTCAGQTYSAGSGFIDSGGDEVHMVRNASATDPAETIAVQILPPGALRRIDEPEPANCHI